MKRVFILIAGLVLLVCLFCYGIGAKNDFYGTYTFEKVSYLAPISSSTIDYINDQMAGTKYIIEADLFKIESKDNPVEISSPNYVKEEIPNGNSTLFDVHTLDGDEIEFQYTIYNKDGSKTYWRLYASSDCLYIASYIDNTANGSEIIKSIYKLSK